MEMLKPVVGCGLWAVGNAACSPADSTHNPPPTTHNPPDVRQAAEQFEALLVGQMLKCMRASGSEGWLGTGEDQAGGLMLELAEEHLAQVLASQGGLGLANLIVQGLSRKP
jgi:Rod binding domain-containing protein